MGATVTLDLERYEGLIKSEKGIIRVHAAYQLPYVGWSRSFGCDYSEETRDFPDMVEFTKWWEKTAVERYGTAIALYSAEKEKLRMEICKYENAKFWERLRYAFTGRLPE